MVVHLLIEADGRRSSMPSLSSANATSHTRSATAPASDEPAAAPGRGPLATAPSAIASVSASRQAPLSRSLQDRHVVAKVERPAFDAAGVSADERRRRAQRGDRRRAVGGRQLRPAVRPLSSNGSAPSTYPPRGRIHGIRAAGRRRSPPLTGDHARLSPGRPPRNKGEQYPADPPTVEEIVAVIRTSVTASDGYRLRA